MNMTRNLKSVALAIAGVIFAVSCSSTGHANTQTTTKPNEQGYVVRSVQRGIASWYSVKTNGGTHTASGERFSNASGTAAHRTLPFGTRVRVINESNGKSEIVRINNRGPFIKGRVIDVSIGTAEKLGFRQRGITKVRVEVLAKPKVATTEKAEKE